jgi:hypothetical protein
VCNLYASTARSLVVTVSDRRYTVDEHFSEQRSGIEEGCIVQDDGRLARQYRLPCHMYANRTRVRQLQGKSSASRTFRNRISGVNGF